MERYQEWGGNVKPTVKWESVQCDDWQKRAAFIVELALKRGKALQLEAIENKAIAASATNAYGDLNHNTEISGGRSG